MNHEDTKTRSFHLTAGLDEEVERIGREIVDSSYAVHRALGPGLLESVYEACLRHELGLRRLRVDSQISVPARYKDVTLDCGFRIDLLVEGCVIVEVKAIEQLMPVHTAQLLTYLKLTRRRLGFLVNFNVPTIKDGIRRLVV